MVRFLIVAFVGIPGAILFWSATCLRPDDSCAATSAFALVFYLMFAVGLGVVSAFVWLVWQLFGGRSGR